MCLFHDPGQVNRSRSFRCYLSFGSIASRGDGTGRLNPCTVALTAAGMTGRISRVNFCHAGDDRFESSRRGDLWLSAASSHVRGNSSRVFACLWRNKVLNPLWHDRRSFGVRASWGGTEVQSEIADSLRAAGERRSEPRGATVFRPVLIEAEDFAGFCLVRNLSEHGMRAKVYTFFAENEALTVRFGPDNSVAGQVIWCDGDHVGVKFCDTIDVAEVLAELSRKEVDGKLNRPLRLPISAPLNLVIDDRAVPAELQDISQRGIKIRSPSVRSGEELTVQLQGLAPRKAVVRWTQGGLAGLNFLQTLSFDDLARWVVQQRLSDDVVAAA